MTKHASSSLSSLIRRHSVRCILLCILKSYKLSESCQALPAYSNWLPKLKGTLMQGNNCSESFGMGLVARETISLSRHVQSGCLIRQ